MPIVNMKKHIKEINHKYFFALILMYAINDMMTSPSVGYINSNRLLVYVFLMSIISFMVIQLFKKEKIRYNSIIINMLIFLYWQIIIQFMGGSFSWNKFIEIGLSLWWPLTILYVGNWQTFSINQKYKLEKFIKFMILFYSAFSIYASYNITNNFQVDYARVNLAYYVIVFIPFIINFSNKRDKFLCLFLVSLISIFSMKRGAIIILPLMLMVNSIVDYLVSGKKIQIKKIPRGITIILLAMIIIIMANTFTEGFLLSRFSYDQLQDGSGRGELIEQVNYNIKQRNLMELILGLKSDSEIVMSEGVHNEWLRVLYEQGLVALLIYGNILFQLIKYGLNMIKIRSEVAGSYWSFLTYYLIITFIGGVYFVHSTFYLMIFLGLIFKYCPLKIKLDKKINYPCETQNVFPTKLIS